jgi:hypothetical protein
MFYEPSELEEKCPDASYSPDGIGRREFRRFDVLGLGKSGFSRRYSSMSYIDWLITRRSVLEASKSGRYVLRAVTGSGVRGGSCSRRRGAKGPVFGACERVCSATSPDFHHIRFRCPMSYWSFPKPASAKTLHAGNLPRDLSIQTFSSICYGAKHHRPDLFRRTIPPSRHCSSTCSPLGALISSAPHSARLGLCILFGSVFDLVEMIVIVAT